MNILFDSMLWLGLFGPAAGIAAAAVRRRHRMWLHDGVTLMNHGRFYQSERLLSSASKPVLALGLTESSPLLIKARVQLCWLWIQEAKGEYAAKSLQKLSQSVAGKPALLELGIEISDAAAWLYLQSGQRREALFLLEDAIKTCRERPEQFSRSLAFASVLCTRGWYHMLEENAAAAGTFLRQSQATLMGAVGAQSIHHLPVLMNMAWLEAIQGDTIEANRMLAHALKTYGPILGKWHPRNAHVLALLGGVAALDRDWKSALEYLQMSAKILRAHGLTHTLQGQKINTALDFLGRM
jgi:tetratricopeptide (TPR) repeat protein